MAKFCTEATVMANNVNNNCNKDSQFVSTKAQNISKMFHPNRRVDSLIQRAMAEGITVETAAVLGFLLDFKPAFISELVDNDSASIYRHDYGYAFTCLNIFRDWCRVPPRKRVEWCKNRSFDNGIFENVCGFVTNVREKIFPGSVNEKMTHFQKERHDTDKKLMGFLMDEMFAGLSVFSGCPSVGYIRLRDGSKIKGSLERGGRPKKFALIFELSGSSAGNKTRKPVVHSCVLHPPEDFVMKYLKSHNDLNEYSRIIAQYHNQLKGFTMSVLPAVLKRCFANVKDCKKYEDELKREEICNVYIKPNYSKDSLAIYCLESDQGKIKQMMQEKLDTEKRKLINHVKRFDYPKKRGTIQVSLKPGGEVDSITTAPSSDNRAVSFDILACCKEHDLDAESLKQYGEVECFVKGDSKENLGKNKTAYLWGKLLCKSVEIAQRAKRHNPM